MNLGITFDEQVLKEIQIQDFIEKLTLKGCGAMEISPDTCIFPLQTYKTVGESLYTNGYTLDYHVPYFSKQHNSNCEFYDIGYFRTHKAQVIAKYHELISIIDTLRQYSVITPNLILHPASYNSTSRNKSEAEEATKFFFDWLLNFLSKRNLDIDTMVETLSNKESSAFNTRTQLLELIQLFDSNNFGICWDLTHDSGNYHTFESPSEAFFKAVNHVHIHGFDTSSNKKHRPLHNESYHCKAALMYLVEHNYSKRLIDELLIYNADHYMTDIFNDLDFLKKELLVIAHP